MDEESGCPSTAQGGNRSCARDELSTPPRSWSPGTRGPGGLRGPLQRPSPEGAAARRPDEVAGQPVAEPNVTAVAARRPGRNRTRRGDGPLVSCPGRGAGDGRDRRSRGRRWPRQQVAGSPSTPSRRGGGATRPAVSSNVSKERAAGRIARTAGWRLTAQPSGARYSAALHDVHDRRVDAHDHDVGGRAERESDEEGDRAGDELAYGMNPPKRPAAPAAGRAGP